MTDRARFTADLIKTVPLGPWLDLAERANVPYVPAEWSNPFTVTQIMGLLDCEPVPEIRAAIEWVERTLRASAAHNGRAMWRWEDCSSGELKWLMANGALYGCPGHFSDLWRMVYCDDPRVIDCAVTNPQRLCVRPWVEPLRIDGFPLEFRVFFGPDGYLGMSNYYPQRPLAKNDDNIVAAHRCIIRANMIYHGGSSCDGESAARWRNYGRRKPARPFPVGCTMDFIVGIDGEIWFLEGGPPHHNQGGPSAHPCCFAPGNISGVALAPQEGSLTT